MFKKTAKADSPVSSQKNRSRLSRLAVPTIISLMAAAILAYIGLALYSHYQAKPAISTAPKHSSSPSSQANPVKPAADPYKGWQQFCGSQYHFCFKYPASGWQLNSSPGTAALTSSDKAVTITYTNPQTSTKSEQFTTVSINKLYKSNIPFKVIGGFAATNYTPTFSVADPISFDKVPQLGKTGT
ncbi:MAG: hypothetical protein ACREGF_05190, partial [Candidatus Saccharimonadales bacterium]